MHRSTRIIICIELATLLGFVALAALVTNAVVREYLQIVILGAAVATGVILLGWARPRGGENKIASGILIVTAVVYQIAIFVLLGVKLGFVTNVYRWNWTSILQVFLPMALIIILMEILRGQMIDKGRRSRGVIILTAIALSFIQIAVAMPMYFPLAAQGFCELMMVVVLPVILTNILLTYIAYMYDYRANIAYRLVIEMPVYLLPIYPDASVFLKALFLILLTIVLIVGFVGTRGWGEQAADTSNKRVKIRRELNDRQRKALRCGKYVAVGCGAILIVGYVGLLSGLFKFYFLAIGSGSMEPVISRGDLILVEKTDKYDQIGEGEVLVYKHNNMIMVHRVSDVEVVGKKYQFRTKGDANDSEDIWQVAESDVIGIAKGKIAMFGFPTLWLNELFNKE